MQSIIKWLFRGNEPLSKLARKQQHQQQQQQQQQQMQQTTNIHKIKTTSVKKMLCNFYKVEKIAHKHFSLDHNKSVITLELCNKLISF